MEDSKSQISNHKVSKHSQALSPVKLHKVKGTYGQVESLYEGEGESPAGAEGLWSIARQEETAAVKDLRLSQSHSKKVIKHALRQQAKRRRKNTTIAAGNSAPLPRITVPTPSSLEDTGGRVSQRPPTMLEVLSSIPGFSIKQRKRSSKKLSAAAQLQQTKEGCIDLETPDSILVNTNLRTLLNKHTFHSLPPLYQYKLVQLLPHVDRSAPTGTDSFRLNPSGLNNEFFSRACLEWKERLAEGEFTPENQQRIKTDAEREKSKLDPWKLKHFEPIWGETTTVIKGVEWTPPPVVAPRKATRAPVKVKAPANPPPPPRLRTVGAVTRAVANYREKREAEENSMLLEPNKRVKTAKHDPVVETLKVNKPLPPPPPPPPVVEPAAVCVPPSPVDEDMKQKEEKVKEDWKERQEITEEDKSEAQTIDKCAELNLSEWDNVEVISVDPVQEYVDVNSQVVKNIEEICESDNFVKIVCDISASDTESIVKDDTDGIGEPFTEVEIRTEEEESEKEVFIIEDAGKECVQNEEESEERELFQYNTENYVPNITLMENNIDESIIEPTIDLGNKNILIDDSGNIDNDEALCESLEESIAKNNINEGEQIMLNEICEKLIDKAVQEGIAMQPEEIIEEQIDGFDIQQNCVVQTETVANQTFIDNTSDTCILNTDEVQTQNINIFSISNEITQEDEIAEENRYDVEMTTVDDSLIRQTCHLLPMESQRNNDSMDSQSTVKEDTLSYCEKMEGEFDSTSNNMSQDSQDILRPEQNSQQFVMPDPEIPIHNALENCTAGQSADNTPYNLYSNVHYQDPMKEEETAAIFAAAWGAVDSSTEKLLAQVALQQQEGEVNVIPMQEELEVRLEEINTAPTCDWPQYDKLTTPLEPTTKPMDPPPQYPGHVKLELEVTLTPEVDSQVTSTVEGGGVTAGGSNNAVAIGDDVKSTPPLTVIPPTTIVCLPSGPHPTPASVPNNPPPQGVVSSSAVPYLALTTSTPVRALPTKPKVSSGPSAGGRSARNVSTKPPPGAVNLERSYQICQAVIQNSPNRDQLRGQLKPPPSLLIGKSDKTQYSVVTSSRGTKPGVTKHRTYQHRPTAPVLVKHVFTSSQGIPVTMAVLPHAQPPNNPEMAASQMGQFVLVQRTGAQARRSNSAPPSNNENLVMVGGRGRPASVGEGGMVIPGSGVESPSPTCYANKLNVRSADCQCSLKAMIACKKCGAFWHDDCIDPSRICVTCHIR